jgi:hypothetical protein
MVTARNNYDLLGRVWGGFRAASRRAKIYCGLLLNQLPLRLPIYKRHEHPPVLENASAAALAIFLTFFASGQVPVAPRVLSTLPPIDVGMFMITHCVAYILKLSRRRHQKSSHLAPVLTSQTCECLALRLEVDAGAGSL